MWHSRTRTPHAYKVLSENTFVAVGILDEPIRWVENDVQVLLLISIADGEHPELQKFYLSITSFMPVSYTHLTLPTTSRV